MRESEGRVCKRKREGRMRERDGKVYERGQFVRERGERGEGV